MKDNNMVSEEYQIAATEVLDVLKHLPDETISKIPVKFRDFLQQVSMDDYEPNIDYSQGLDKIQLRDKSKALLAMIYKNYLCTDEERKEFDELLLENERKYQEELREKYNPDNLFKKDIDIVEEDTTDNRQLIEYKEEKWYLAIWNKVIQFLKKFAK